MRVMQPLHTLKDTSSFLKCFTFRKFLNSFSLALSYGYTSVSHRYYHRGSPAALAVETYAGCTLRCPECPAGTGSDKLSNKALPVELFTKTLEEVGSSLVYLSFHFLGEPLLHPGLWEMVGMATARSIYTEIHTNAQLMDDSHIDRMLDSGLHRLRISVDGADQETYGEYRKGGSLDRVLLATEKILERRTRRRSTKPYLIWQFIVFRHNENQLDDIRKLARSYGVDALDIKTAWLAGQEGSMRAPELKRFNRYAGKEVSRGPCWRTWHSIIIGADGMILPCCYDKSRSYVMGDAMERNVIDSWRSASFHEFRKAGMRGESDICSGCRT